MCSEIIREVGSNPIFAAKIKNKIMEHIEKRVTKDGNVEITITDVRGIFEQFEYPQSMLVPVRCNYCGQIYDLTAATPITRHADCTTFKSPCCGIMCDDRMYKSSPDFKRLDGIK